MVGVVPNARLGETICEEKIEQGAVFSSLFAKIQCLYVHRSVVVGFFPFSFFYWLSTMMISVSLFAASYRESLVWSLCVGGVDLHPLRAELGG